MANETQQLALVVGAGPMGKIGQQVMTLVLKDGVEVRF